MEYREQLILSKEEVIELLDVLVPFANMDRADYPPLDKVTDLTEVACERGTASDKTIITNQNFREINELVREIIELMQNIKKTKPTDDGWDHWESRL